MRRANRKLVRLTEIFSSISTTSRVEVCVGGGAGGREAGISVRPINGNIRILYTVSVVDNHDGTST